MYLRFDDVSLNSVAVSDRALCEITDEPTFSDLEWLIVRIARNDPLSSLRQRRRAPLLRLFFPARASLHLADPRLEALRRFSVLIWRVGTRVGELETQRFFAAGYSQAQHDMLLSATRSTCC